MSEDFLNLLVNNGVAVSIIFYFCVRDWKFNTTIMETLTAIKLLIEERKGE